MTLRFTDYLDRYDFIEKIETGYLKNDIKTISHLKACSTTEKNADYLMENNYRYTKDKDKALLFQSESIGNGELCTGFSCSPTY